MPQTPTICSSSRCGYRHRRTMQLDLGGLDQAAVDLVTEASVAQVAAQLVGA